MSTIAERATASKRALRLPGVGLLERENHLGYLLLLPTMAVLTVFLLYPFLFGLWLSLTSSEVGNVGNFVGVANYSFLIRVDRVFHGTPWSGGQWGAFFNTFTYTIVTTIFKLGLGLLMALLLNQVFPLQRFVRAALLLPWIIPTVLSYLSWRWMFDPTFSVINWVLVHTHLASSPPNWLGVPANAMTALIIANIWRGTPFYGISFLAGLQVIPLDLYEAARVDGATRWQQFRNITLPMLRPVLLVVLLLSTILTFADFQGPYILTNGAPYNSSHVLATWAYTWAIQGDSLGLGAAVSLFLFPVLSLVIAGVLILLRRPE
jgi:multiple sugar transport system permease protein